MRRDIFQLVAKFFGVFVEAGPSQLLNQAFESLRRRCVACSLVSREPCALQHSILQGVNIFTHIPTQHPDEPNHCTRRIKKTMIDINWLRCARRSPPQPLIKVSVMWPSTQPTLCTLPSFALGLARIRQLDLEISESSQ